MRGLARWWAEVSEHTEGCRCEGRRRERRSKSHAAAEAPQTAAEATAMVSFLDGGDAVGKANMFVIR